MDSHTLAGVSLIIRQSDIFRGTRLACAGKLYFKCLPSCVTATLPVGVHVGIVCSQCGSAYRFVILIGGHPPQGQYGAVCAVKKPGSPPPRSESIRVGAFHDDIADCHTGLIWPNANTVWLFECESRLDVTNLVGREKGVPARIEQHYIIAGLGPTVLNVSRENISASLKIVDCAIIIAVSDVTIPIID